MIVYAAQLASLKLGGSWALGLLGAISAPHAPRITLEANAQSVPALLAKLSQESGIKLECDSSIGREVAAIRVQDVDFDQLSEKLATAVSGAWSKAGAGWKLERPEAFAKKLREAELKRRTELIKSQIAQAVEQSSLAQPLTSEKADKLVQEGLHFSKLLYTDNGGIQLRDDADFAEQKLRDIQAQLGEGRLLARCLALMNPEELAAIPSIGRAVYTVSPTSVQRALPGGVTPDIKNFEGDYHTWLSCIGNHHDEIIAVRVQISPGPDFRAKAPEAFDKPYVTLQRGARSQALEATLMMPNSDGNIVAEAVRVLAAGLKDPVIKGEPTEQALTYSREIADFAAMWKGGVGTPAFLPKLCDPSRNEPLAFAAGPLFIEASRTRNENMIVCLPDWVVAKTARRVAQGPMKPSELLNAADMTWGMEVDEETGWLTARPRWATESWNQRMDRAAFAQLIKTASSTRVLRLDDVARYAASRGEQTTLDSELLSFLTEPILNATDRSRQLATNGEMLRLYGSLSPSQRTVSDQGQNLSFSGLNKDQQNSVRHRVFDYESGPAVSIPNITAIRAERTEVLRAGIPFGAIVAVRPTPVDGFLATVSATGKSALLATNDLIMALAQKQLMEKGKKFKATPYDQFRPARATVIRLNYGLAEQVNLSADFNDWAFDGNSKPLAYADLPQAMRTKIDEIVQNSLSFGGGGGFGGPGRGGGGRGGGGG